MLSFFSSMELRDCPAIITREQSCTVQWGGRFHGIFLAVILTIAMGDYDSSSSPAGRIRARTRIGSSGTAVHYARDEHAFHPTDVPAKARAARLEVRSALGQTGWDSRCSLEPERVKPPLRHTMSQLATREFTYNYRAETLPPLRPVTRDVFGRPISLDLSGVS